MTKYEKLLEANKMFPQPDVTNHLFAAHKMFPNEVNSEVALDKYLGHLEECYNSRDYV